MSDYTPVNQPHTCEERYNLITYYGGYDIVLRILQDIQISGKVEPKTLKAMNEAMKDKR